MDGIKNIEIKNFRGIELMGIEDLARVNILLGQNNCGKSTVLEALMFVTGMSNPFLPQNLNSVRSRNLFSGVTSFKYLFHNMDMRYAPSFFADQFNGEKRELSLNVSYKPLGGSSQETAVLSTETKTFVNTIELDFAFNATRHKSSITFNPNGAVAQQHLSEDYVELINSTLISADISSHNPINDLGELVKRQQKSAIIQLLQKFDSRINTLEIVSNEVFLGFDGLGELLPVSMSGDGLKRYLSIVAAAANPNDSIILIDEIDNGLHYSAYKKLWEAIFALAVSTNKQIFVTTHSKETLLKLNEMLEEHPEYQDEMALYTLEQTKLKGHQAYRLPYEGLAEACKNNVEIRSVAL
jgi:AAA15 family ATPase/GTPase